MDAEAALRATTDKFMRRFEHVEKRARQEHGALTDPSGQTLPLETLDGYWQEAKSAEAPRGELDKVESRS